MRRRDVLRGLMVATSATALAVAGAAARAAPELREVEAMGCYQFPLA